MREHGKVCVKVKMIVNIDPWSKCYYPTCAYVPGKVYCWSFGGVMTEANFVKWRRSM